MTGYIVVAALSSILSFLLYDKVIVQPLLDEQDATVAELRKLQRIIR